ncbi:hypothetical protein CPB83DRAFT_856038 [Crepidotus variabilis]|uniref:SnoaL-like domain-containing protein n=1 Tax=Crepidotus variabilis TaxID=179855 RepID=A0A9P6EES0_9AGAR|nr:hypothetical protein CPB83DRAFT_856038 [Crepidotus variabilis]
MSASDTSLLQEDTIETLKKEYNLYLAAQYSQDAAMVESFMSPSCWQLARQNSSWNLASRDVIMGILTGLWKMDDASKKNPRGKVEMRALTAAEKETIPEAQKGQARKEAWEGLNVLLEDPDPDGRVVRVNYYWRKEEGRWVQCFHDLLWVGSKNPDKENDVGAAVFEKK